MSISQSKIQNVATRNPNCKLPATNTFIISIFFAIKTDSCKLLTD